MHSRVEYWKQLREECGILLNWSASDKLIKKTYIKYICETRLPVNAWFIEWMNEIKREKLTNWVSEHLNCTNWIKETIKWRGNGGSWNKRNSFNLALCGRRTITFLIAVEICDLWVWISCRFMMLTQKYVKFWIMPQNKVKPKTFGTLNRL